MQFPKSLKPETDTSYLFEGDEWLYKIKKEGNEFPTCSQGSILP